MSAHNFSRIFRDCTGETPADFVELVRVDAARRSLEGDDAAIQRITIDCRFTNADIICRAFCGGSVLGRLRIGRGFVASALLGWFGDFVILAIHRGIPPILCIT